MKKWLVFSGLGPVLVLSLIWLIKEPDNLHEQVGDNETADSNDVAVAVTGAVSYPLATDDLPEGLKGSDQVAYVDVTPIRENEWQIGDLLSFVIPQTNYTLETQIEEVREFQGGVKVIKSYPDETMANHVLITISKKNTFMSLFTPDGEYELVGDHERAWIAPARLLGGPTEDDVDLPSSPSINEQVEEHKHD